MHGPLRYSVIPLSVTDWTIHTFNENRANTDSGLFGWPDMASKNHMHWNDDLLVVPLSSTQQMNPRTTTNSRGTYRTRILEPTSTIATVNAKYFNYICIYLDWLIEALYLQNVCDWYWCYNCVTKLTLHIPDPVLNQQPLGRKGGLLWGGVEI